MLLWLGGADGRLRLPVGSDEGVDWLRNGRDKQAVSLHLFSPSRTSRASPDKMTAGYSEVARNKLGGYFANVENMDAAVGKLMATWMS